MRPAFVIATVAALSLGAFTAAVWYASQARRDASVRLSLFEPHAGGCGWYVLDVDRLEELPVVHFPTDCTSVQAAWGPDLRAALVWFNAAGYPSRDDMLFQVDIPRQKAWRLPLPDVGEAQAFAFDGDGRIVAFTEDQQVAPGAPVAAGDDDVDAADAAAAADDADDAVGAPVAAAGPPAAPAPAWIDFGGRRFPASTFPEGQDVLVHALTLDQGRWRLTETQASRCCADGAPGIQALAAYTASGDGAGRAARLTTAQLTAAVPSRGVEDAAVLAAAAQRLPPGVAAEPPLWRLLLGAGWPRALLFRGSAPAAAHATGVAFFLEGARIRAIPGFAFAPNDVLQPVARGDYLLVTDWATGMAPHLYDMRTGHLVYSSQVAFAATFWPADPAHEAPP